MMSEEELYKLLDNNWNNYFAPALTNIDFKIQKLHDEFEKEHEELKTRVITAETKLKLYEALFGKLNLNMELKNEQ